MVSVPGRDKNLLGKPHWDGVPPAPRGMPQIEVTFDTEGQTFTTYADTSRGDDSQIRRRLGVLPPALAAIDQGTSDLSSLLP